MGAILRKYGMGGYMHKNDTHASICTTSEAISYLVYEIKSTHLMDF